MLELFTKKPIFQGNDEIHQVEVLFKLLGTPTLERWPDVMNLPWYELVKPQQVMPYRFREAFEKYIVYFLLNLAVSDCSIDGYRSRVSILQSNSLRMILQNEFPPGKLWKLLTSFARRRQLLNPLGVFFPPLSPSDN